VPTERWVAALRAAVRAELPAAISLRHDLHGHPDLSGSEEATAGLIRRALGPLTGTPVAGPGMLARVGRHDGPATAVRAELDALPVTEKTGVPWSASGAVAATPGAINAAVCNVEITVTGAGGHERPRRWHPACPGSGRHGDAAGRGHGGRAGRRAGASL
jgi:metal-dependent amidase/aminoacylase/carboxypeptidase family protein